MRKITPTTNLYSRTDILIKFLLREFIEMFGDFKAKLLTKDETNILFAVNDLYSRLRAITEEKLLELAQIQLEYMMQGDYDESLIDSAWLQEFLYNYNDVTKYVYANEIDRKRSYLYEALMSSDTPVEDIDKALRLWSIMVGQMAVDVTDRVTLMVYEVEGVSFVRWVSEHDSRRCNICKNLDGEVFRIDEIPHKPHINCRCFTIPVRRYKR